jgi:hypothetical protein
MKKLWAILAFISVLSGCGGGGGGSESGKAPQPAPTAQSAVHFSPEKVSATYETGTSTTVSVKATVNNPSDFIGASTVVANIVDEKGVITTNVNIEKTGDGEFTATLHTSPSLAPGRYQGNLLLKLCRDLACASQYPGSPSLLPYELQVLPAGAAKLSATSATPLNATMHYAGAAPSNVNVSVTGKDLNWTARTNASWLKLTGASGSGDGGFVVGFAPANLTEGEHRETITVPDGANFSAINGAPIAPQSFDFTLNNDAPTAWTATSDAAWLTVDPANGTTPATATLRVDPTVGPLGSGTYDGQVTLSAAGIASKSYRVKLALTKPTVAVSTSNITFGEGKGRDFSSRTLTLSLNTKTNSWPWTISGLPNWVIASASSGSVNESGTTITFTPDVDKVPVGTTTVTFNVTAQVNGDSLVVPVTATIHKDQHKILAMETGVAFASTPTWSRLSRIIPVSDNFGKATAWTAASDQPWLSVTTAGATGSGDSSITLNADPASLPNDTVSYATVTITASDPTINAAEKIKVALWKGAATPTAITKVSQDYTKLFSDPIRPFVYVHSGGTSIDVYNIYTGTKTRTISGVGAALGDMTISGNGDQMYILDTASRKMVVVDLQSQTKLTSSELTNAVSTYSTLKAIRPNGVGVIVVGDGTAYAAADGRSLGNTGISGVITASADGKKVFTQNEGISPATVSSYIVDYSEMSGGALMVGTLKTASAINQSSNGADIAVSGDGTRLYAASGAPYRCSRIDPTALSFVGSLPGGDAYPNNVKVGSDGRVYCGISGWYSPADVWVHLPDGSLQTSFKFAGYAKALRQRQLVISGDGLTMAALTDDPLLVFVPVGP